MITLLGSRHFRGRHFSPIQLCTQPIHVTLPLLHKQRQNSAGPTTASRALAPKNLHPPSSNSQPNPLRLATNSRFSREYGSETRSGRERQYRKGIVCGLGGGDVGTTGRVLRIFTRFEFLVSDPCLSLITLPITSSDDKSTALWIDQCTYHVSMYLSLIGQ